MDNKETQSQGVNSNQEVVENGAVSLASPVKSRNNPMWMIASIILAIVLVAVVIFPVNAKSKTLATVNGTDITESNLFTTMQEYYGDSVVNILDRMISEEVVNQEAKAKNVSVTDKDRADEIAAMKLDYGSEENFQGFLAQYGMTEDDLKKELELSVLVRLLLQSDVAVTDEQVQAYFDENKATLGGSAEQVRASHILVTDKAVADDILAQLKGGADFAKLAAENNPDSTAQTGGDLGFFTRDAMIPAFSEAAFALEVDELSEPVQTDYGYHIIKKTGYTPATEVEFDTVKDAIKVKLINESIYTNNSTYVEDLKAKAKIKNSLAPEATPAPETTTDTEATPPVTE